MVSNCLIFALSKWFKHGGYLIIRKSRVGWWPHLLWTSSLSGLEVENFVPVDKDMYLRAGIFPPLLFKGEIKFNDELEHE